MKEEILLKFWIILRSEKITRFLNRIPRNPKTFSALPVIDPYNG
jgi:hypothetical protein